MEFKVQFAVVFLAWTFVITAARCPEDRQDWVSDFKEGKRRCILRCKDGMVPSGCHVIRPIKGGGFNKPIPVCEKAPWVSGKTVASVAAGVVAVFVAPYALAAAGFTHAGVAASSIAASVQTPLTEAGSWFALGQSAGTAGLGVGAKTAIGGSVSLISNYVMNTFTGCERE